MYSTKGILKKEIFTGNLWKSIRWKALLFGLLSFLVIPLSYQYILLFFIGWDSIEIVLGLGILFIAISFFVAGFMTSRLARPYALWHIIVVNLLSGLFAIYLHPDFFLHFNVFYLIPFLCFTVGSLCVRQKKQTV